MVTAAMKLKDTCSWEEKSCNKPRHIIKKQKHGFAKKSPLPFAIKGPYKRSKKGQSYGFFQ